MRGDSVTAEELQALLTEEEFQKLRASASGSEESLREIVALTPLQATQAILELQATVRELTARLDEWTKTQQTISEERGGVEGSVSATTVAPVSAVPPVYVSATPPRANTHRKQSLWKRWIKK